MRLVSFSRRTIDDRCSTRVRLKNCPGHPFRQSEIAVRGRVQPRTGEAPRLRAIILHLTCQHSGPLRGITSVC